MHTCAETVCVVSCALPPKALQWCIFPTTYQSVVLTVDGHDINIMNIALFSLLSFCILYTTYMTFPIVTPRNIDYHKGQYYVVLFIEIPRIVKSVEKEHSWYFLRLGKIEAWGSGNSWRAHCFYENTKSTFQICKLHKWVIHTSTKLHIKMEDTIRSIPYLPSTVDPHCHPFQMRQPRLRGLGDLLRQYSPVNSWVTCLSRQCLLHISPVPWKESHFLLGVYSALSTWSRPWLALD